MTTSRLYGQELRTEIVDLLSQIPEVRRVNYLEYWNDHLYIIFVEPNSEDTRNRVENALNTYLENQGARRTWTVQARFKSVGDPVPSSQTLYQRP